MNTHTSGTQIGRYKLDSMVGMGASGQVWKAFDGDKLVAVKFMNVSLLESDSAAKHRQRMEREINTLKSLQHPNIPTFFDANLDYVPPYLVMTYIDGETYDKLLADGRVLQIPLAKRLENIKALASALDTAHAAGIIHRDIKPANIISVEHPYLIDFGLAIQELNLDETMRQVGTSLYMPPETDSLDNLSDSYAFAVVTYELLFGGHPIFRAEDGYLGAAMYLRFLAGERIAKGQWYIPSQIPTSEIPLDLRQSDMAKLDKVFTKALSDHDTRYPESKTFVADLEAAITLPQTNVTNTPLPISPNIENLPTQLESDPSADTDKVPSPIPSVPLSPLEAPVAPYTRPNRAPDQFTVLEVEKAQTQAQSKPSRLGMYAALGVVFAVIIVLLVLLVTHHL